MFEFNLLLFIKTPFIEFHKWVPNESLSKSTLVFDTQEYLATFHFDSKQTLQQRPSKEFNKVRY